MIHQYIQINIKYFNINFDVKKRSYNKIKSIFRSVKFLKIFNRRNCQDKNTNLVGQGIRNVCRMCTAYLTISKSSHFPKTYIFDRWIVRNKFLSLVYTFIISCENGSFLLTCHIKSDVSVRYKFQKSLYHFKDVWKSQEFNDLLFYVLHYQESKIFYK